MEINEIKKHIDAFYNGETNKEDEQTLRNYFNSSDVTDELQHEKELFLQLYENDAPEVPLTLEKRLEKTINRLERQEQELLARRKTLKRLWIRAVSVAAGLALLVSIGWLIGKNDNNTSQEVAIAHLSEEDQQKLREAEKALLLLSTTFNKGIEQMELISMGLEKTTTVLNNSLNR